MPFCVIATICVCVEEIVDVAVGDTSIEFLDIVNL